MKTFEILKKAEAQVKSAREWQSESEQNYLEQNAIIKQGRELSKSIRSSKLFG